MSYVFKELLMEICEHPKESQVEVCGCDILTKSITMLFRYMVVQVRVDWAYLRFAL